MKKFQFPLDTVLGYKQQVLENLQNEHSVLVRRVREQESLIAGLEADYAALSGLPDALWEQKTIEDACRLLDRYAIR